jgi:D-sedoheptulose 7-phosphate isomerase
METYKHYLSTVQSALDKVNSSHLQSVTETLYRAYQSGHQVFTMGNGASASLAAHMACDIGKGTSGDLARGPVRSGQKRLRIISLSDNVSLLTAYGNDISYEDVFLEQLKNLLNPGDVVLGISGSGSSPNILRAMKYARAMKAVTIGFTGMQGQALQKLCDVCVTAPLASMEQIEDLHVIFSHAIGLDLRKKILGDAGNQGG